MSPQASAAGTAPVPLLTLNGLSKSYGVNAVLTGIDLVVERGEILALVGENGAGKSTLMRIVGGYTDPSGGAVAFDGGPRSRTVSEAEARGIVLVHQEFNLAPHLTVAENVFLGREPTRGIFIDHRRMRREAAEALAELGCPVDPGRSVSACALSDLQMIEVAKALKRAPRLLLMDEPTAVLSSVECGRLFRRLDSFRAAGGSAVFTSHKLDEVRHIADRVAVLRDGAIVRVAPAASLSEAEMAALMVGRPLSDLFPRKPAGPSRPREIVAVEGLASPGRVEDASFAVNAGEVLGVAGLVGSGRTEMMEALLGLRAASVRRFALRGVDRVLPSAREAWKLGLAYLTEDRKGKGLLLDTGLRENLALTAGALAGRAWIDAAAERRDLRDAIGRFSIRVRDEGVPARSLSGGNQQKLLIAKTLRCNPDLVVFDEPTRGVDIGAKQQIYGVIADLAAEGRACVVISSEMNEMVGLCHRVLVMRRGRIVGELQGGDVSEDRIVRLAMGVDGSGAHGRP